MNGPVFSQAPPALLSLYFFKQTDSFIPCWSPCLQTLSNSRSPHILTSGLLFLALIFMVYIPCSRALAKGLPFMVWHLQYTLPASFPSIFYPGNWTESPCLFIPVIPTSSNIYLPGSPYTSLCHLMLTSSFIQQTLLNSY